MQLQELRKEIDRIDSELLALIQDRMQIVGEVAEFKRKNGLPVFAPDREVEVLNRLAEKVVDPNHTSGVVLLYGIIMDLNKLNEYRVVPKNIDVPTGLGGASVRAIIPNTPGTLCRYISPLAAAEVSVADIHSTALPGGKMVVDLELVGNTSNPNFAAALSVLADTSEKFTLL